MKAQEKAEDLFITYVNKGMNQIKPVINRVIRKEMAKQCALIAVDEILLNEPNKAYFIKNTWVTPKTYWIEVKNELEKL